jgi:hypothetical protein
MRAHPDFGACAAPAGAAKLRIAERENTYRNAKHGTF